MLEPSGSAVGAILFGLVGFLLGTITGDVSFLLTVSTGPVLVVGRSLQLGVPDVGRFLQVGLAFPTLRLSVARLLAVMTNNIFIAVLAVGSTVAALLVLRFTTTFGTLELRLHLLVRVTILEAMSVGLVDRTAPLFTVWVLTTFRTVGGLERELFQTGTAVRVELWVFFVALL